MMAISGFATKPTDPGFRADLATNSSGDVIRIRE